MATARQTAKVTTLTIEFKREKDTKNTVRYTEVPVSEDAPSHIGTLYLQKSAGALLCGSMPDALTVTLTVGK